MDAPDTAVAGQWMRDYVAESLSRPDLERFIDEICESMGADVPELSADAEITRDLQSAVRSQFHQVLVIKQTDNTHRWEVPVVEEAYSLARTIARRGLDLRVLSQLYHAGHRAVWRFVVDFVNSADLPADFKVQIVVMMWEQTSEVMNHMLEELAAAYTGEREALLSGALSMRINTIHAVLEGEQSDADAASRLLSYPIHRTHTALVLWTGDSPEQLALDSLALGSLAARLARSAGCAETLSVPSGSRGLWAWMVAADGPEPAIDPTAVPVGVHVAMGRPGRGIEGFRRTHREAVAAQRIASGARHRGPVTSYRDVELVSMLAADPAAMGTLIERELSGLLDQDEASARLRETLRAVLAGHGNFEAAARRLAVHKNTVRYRVQQIETRLGRRIGDRALHLELALDCLDTFAVPPAQGSGAALDQ